MAKKRPVVEYQQSIAENKLKRYEDQLRERKVQDTQFKRDPIWRNLKAKLDKLKAQIRYVEKRESFAKKSSDSES